MNSKVLKVISYILMPFVILGIMIPIAYYSVKTENIETMQKEHFDTESFGMNYIFFLRDEAKNLIYNKNYYYVSADGNTTIRYTARDNDTYYSENYFLIMYKDIAYTNVNYSEKTDTIIEIKDYIKNFADNNIEISKGNILTNKENLKIEFSEHYQIFNMSYYSKIEEITETKTENTDDIALSNEVGKQVKIIEEVTGLDGEILGVAEVTNNGEREISDYDPNDLSEYETHKVIINDFEIYANFSGKLPEGYYGSGRVALSDFLSRYEEQYTYILPISVILFFVILIYLIWNIGSNKNGKCELNDLDKIYIEIVLIVSVGIICILIALISNLITEKVFNKMNGLSLLFSIYIAIYIIIAFLGTTIIKRVKAKEFVKTSLILKCSIWCFRKLKEILKWFLGLLKYIKNVVLEILSNKKLFVRLCIYSVLMIIIMVYLLMLFGIIGAVLDAWIFIFVLYIVYKYLNSVEKIEKHLEEMYEGKNVDDIDLLSIEKNLRKIAVYVNNISNGIDNLVEEQMKSERMKTELITNVSHDIKTPLTSIINYIDLLKKENLESEKAKEYLDVLDAKSQRLKKLIEDLVDASKASSGTVKLNLEKINVKELMMQAIGEFEDKFKSKGLKVELKTDRDDIIILADAKYLYRVIDNAFGNIVKYALENTRVYVDLKEVDGEVLLDIKNISKEELNISSDELMQRFVRGDKSRTTEGSGLGLSIAKSLVELQKGKFNIVIDGDLFKVSIIFKLYKN